MRINCFRAASSSKCVPLDDDRPESPRPANFAKKNRKLHRQSTGESQISSASSKSIESMSKLPPCKRASEQIEAMMMPLPHEPRPSRCLRLSHPRTYGALVYDMKASKGCRDWRNFPVFYNEDVDMSISADEAARKKAIDYQRKVRQLNCSFSDSDGTDTSIEADMIG